MNANKPSKKWSFVWAICLCIAGAAFAHATDPQKVPEPACESWFQQHGIRPAQTRIHFDRSPRYTDFIESGFRLGMRELRIANDDGLLVLQSDSNSGRLTISGVCVFERPEWDIVELKFDRLILRAESKTHIATIEIIMGGFRPSASLEVFRVDPSGKSNPLVMNQGGFADAFKVDFEHPFLQIRELLFGRAEAPRRPTLDDRFFDEAVLGQSPSRPPTPLQWISGLSDRVYVPWGEGFVWFDLVEGLKEAGTNGTRVQFPFPKK
jgi:hypothetical protein